MSKQIKLIVGVALILSGLIIIFKGAVLGGLLIALVGVAILPVVSERYKEKFPFWRNNTIRRATLGILLFMGFAISGNQLGSNNEKTENIAESNAENSLELKNNVQVMNLDKVYYDANGDKVEPDSNDITYKVLEVLDHDKTETPDEKNNFENFHLLVKISSYKKEDLEKIAFAIKDEYAQFAPNNCNIDLWDDKKAYQSYLAQQKYYNQSFEDLMEVYKRTGVPIGEKHDQLKKQYDKKNYPFIADHLPADITLGNHFGYYPLQDDYYKEVGGKNYKK